MGFVSKRIARRIDAVSEFFNEHEPTVEHEGTQLSDEEFEALLCGITTGLETAKMIASGEISPKEDVETIASVTLAVAHSAYELRLDEMEDEHAKD